MANSKNLIIPGGSKDRDQELSFTAGGNGKMVHTLWKTVWQLPTKLSIVLPYDLALLCLQLNRLKSYIHTKT